MSVRLSKLLSWLLRHGAEKEGFQFLPGLVTFDFHSAVFMLFEIYELWLMDSLQIFFHQSC